MNKIAILLLVLLGLASCKLDVTASGNGDGSHFTQIGSQDWNTPVYNLAGDGAAVFIALGTTGTAVVDYSIPSQPLITRINSANGAKVYHNTVIPGQYLLTAAETTGLIQDYGTGWGLSTLRYFDAPGSWYTAYDPQSKTAWLACGDYGIVSYDLSNINAPREGDDWTTNQETLLSLAYTGEFLLAGGERGITSLRPVAGGYDYCDYTSLQNVYELVYSREYIYAAYRDGVAVLTLDDDGSIRVVGNCPLYRDEIRCLSVNGYVLWAGSAYYGVHRIDISNPESPFESDSYACGAVNTIYWTGRCVLAGLADGQVIALSYDR